MATRPSKDAEGAKGKPYGRWLVVVVVMVMVILGTQIEEVGAKVRLVNHGYEGVVIAISPYITQDNAILVRLKKYLTETSRTLFRATHNRLYFREFVIVIPETWKGIKDADNTLDFPMDFAQIIIDHPNTAYGDAPYVKQYAECGQPGLYIHLTPTYLKDNDVINKWGPPEKTLVHEWAHLRWGLFDEYPIDPQDAEFYQHEGKWYPTRCTEEVDGSIHNKFNSKECSFDMYTGTPEKACLFFPNIKSNRAPASLMFMQYLESIVEFCDHPASASSTKAGHNQLAQNRQNRLCAYRSAWEVMKKHEDFRKAENHLTDQTDTTPRFRIIQIKPKKRVLVLDTSGSMTGSSLSVMMQATTSYILSCVELGSSLGIIQFNTNATVLSPMTPIRSEKDRHHLIKKLPRQAEGKTSIGAGLEMGLQLLNSVKDKRNDQGSIILITDGKENERPFLTDFQPKLLSKGVVVHSFSYGQRADKSVAQLSRSTGGKLFFYSGRKDSTALIDGLAATVTTESSNLPADVPISVLTEARTVFGASPFTGTFVIDGSVGRNTSVTVSYTNPVTARVISPSNVTMTSQSQPLRFLKGDPSGMVQIDLPDNAEIGKWTYVIVTNELEADVTVNVQSKSRTPETDVLQVRSWLSWLPENNTVSFDAKQKITLFAELVQGRSPVLNADIVAVIERPQSAPLRVGLHDNGMGSDIIRDDGVYAAYVMAGDMKGNGRYNIKVLAQGENGATRLVTGGKGLFSGALEVTSSGAPRELVTEELQAFQRVTSAGEFRVTGFPEGVEVMEDGMAPSRIADLQVVRFDFDSGEAVVRWTAVGDDMDRGTASKYLLHISTSFADLFALDLKRTAWTAEVGEWTLSTLSPQTAGQVEHANLTLKTLGENNTLYLGVRAVDDSGNAGEMSNIITLSRARVLAVPIAKTPAGNDLQFYVKLIVPPVAALLLFAAFAVLVMRSRRRVAKMSVKEKVEVGSRVSVASVLSLDMSFMNYRHDGQYRLRHDELHETWSQQGRSVESLDKL
ncbi:hypothetical protein ACOMHN_026119 [Nucella lapillus]